MTIKTNIIKNNIKKVLVFLTSAKIMPVIAFGGGSPMDCAKVAAARVAAPNKQIPKMRGTLKVLAKLPPLYA
ncbi:MAG: iron-containing alcohol dehydrogenase, partial [Clostridia bacterium]|nr:iron-containing alcohol dehydrogenase [Clostridia bacterium]